jgi:Outer membrane protein (OmpH-like)
MNHKLVLLAALVTGLLPVSAVAQASPELPASPSPAPAAGPATPAPKPPSPPSAFAAKIAIVEFEQAVIGTNEGQRALEEIKKKFEPKQTQLEALNTEIVSLQKQLQGAPSTMTDEERATRTKTLDIISG